MPTFDCPRPPLRLPLRAFGALLAALLAGCGGGGGGGGGGAGGGAPGGGGVGGNQAPTAAFVVPTTGAALLPGDTISISFTANDADDVAVVSLLVDADRNPATTGDQLELYAGVEADGAQIDVRVRIPRSLSPGLYALVLRVDDATNPPLEVLLPRDLILYTAVAGVAPPRSNRYALVGSTYVVSRGELEDGAMRLNADADTADGVYASIDLQTGLLNQPAPSVTMDVTGAGGGVARPIPVNGGVVAWLTFEADEGRTLNGLNAERGIPPIGGPDVDAVDAMVSFVVPATSLLPVTNTWGGAAGIVARTDGKLVVHYQEAGEGNPGGGSDLNFDFDTLDAVFGYIDPSAAGVSTEFNQIVFCDVPAAATAGPLWRDAGPQYAAMQVSEAASPLGSDFNADGDQTDTLLWLGDLLQGGGTGASANFTTLAGTQPPPTAALPTAIDPGAGFDLSLDGHAAYYADETANNAPLGAGAGVDRNGDFVLGLVPMLYSIATATEIIPIGAAGPINAPAGAATMIYDGTRAFFTAQEAPRLDPVAGGGILGTNGDGDNGADQAILYWTDHTAVPPVAAPVPVAFGGVLTLNGLSLDQGGQVRRLAPGWLAVVVNELANGGQDINGSGAMDLAFLLVDTTTNPMPTVHNPRIVPSAAGSIPVTGITAPQADQTIGGVVVRLTEAANGILDADGNATDTFFAYIPFQFPTQVRILDAGGNHCTASNGLIGVTAIESLTGMDYDGNLRATDMVFRVFDLMGAVVEAGRLCSPFSVPTTDDGRTWAYLRDEAVEGRSLNGDGDQGDVIFGLWMP